MVRKVVKGTAIIIPEKIYEKNLELRKPSELCQVLYYKDFNKEEFAVLTPMQLNLISIIFYFISDSISKQNLTEDEIYDWISMNHFELNLQSISEILGTYKNGYYAIIVKNLQELSKIQVLTNILHKNKTRELTLFHFLRKISWVQDNKNISKRVKVWIEPELLAMFIKMKSYYTKFSLQIQLGLKSKYSKLLYEVMKDYSGSGVKNIDFEMLKALLNVDVLSKPTLNNWSNFNRDVLKRCVNEINAKSDIVLEYTPVKERIDKKLTVVSVNFNIKKQKSKLINYEKEYTNHEFDVFIVSDSDNEINMKDSTPIETKLIQLAQERMKDVIENGTVVKNPQKYLETVIENIRKEGNDIVSMIEMDNILDELKSQFPKKDTRTNQLMILENFMGEPIVVISSNYLLYSPLTKSNITETIKETINKIKEFKKSGGKFKIIETHSRVPEMEKSYL